MRDIYKPLQYLTELLEKGCNVSEKIQRIEKECPEQMMAANQLLKKSIDMWERGNRNEIDNFLNASVMLWWLLMVNLCAVTSSQAQQ